MKYCKNCGMLLEDTHEHCIACGTDVTKAENVSKYPPGVRETIESQKKENKTRRGIVGAIIVVFVLLLALVGVIIMQASKMSEEKELPKAAEETEQADAESDAIEEALSAELNADVITEEEAADTAPASGRKIKDDKGSYYTYLEASDAGGNVVFTSVYPEDFISAVPMFDYGKYSTKYPELLTFVVGNEDNTARFTYMSPQQFWYKASETGKTRNNERDIVNYMSYLTYDGAEGYVEALIKQGYSDAKKVTLLETAEADEAITKNLEELSKEYTRTLTGDIGDYAHIGEDTTYATMESEFSVNLLKYEITTKNNSTLYCDFYVPLIANHFYYANDTSDDRGTVTEWIALSVIGFEAGNDELYDEFEEAFFVFAKNTKVNQAFYYINEQYGKELEKAVADGEEPEPLDKEKLEAYKKSLNQSASLNDLNQGLLEFSELNGSADAVFVKDNQKVAAPAECKLVYYNADTKKMFLSPDETEYPGDDYTLQFTREQ